MTRVRAIVSPNRVCSGDFHIRYAPRMLNAGRPSTSRRTFLIMLLRSPGFRRSRSTTRVPAANLPMVTPSNPSSRIKYKAMNIRNTAHMGSKTINPECQRWSLILMIHVPFTIRAIGKNRAQKTQKSMNSPRKRRPSPAYESVSFPTVHAHRFLFSNFCAGRACYSGSIHAALAVSNGCP
jgi:hypothetical protein